MTAAEARLVAALEALAGIDAARADALLERDAAIRQVWLEDGLSTRRLAERVGLSHARVAQILAGFVPGHPGCRQPAREAMQW